MNFEVLEKAGIDIEDALVRFSGNKELLEKYLLKFIDEPVFKTIISSMDEKNWILAEDSVHSFKGITGSLGIKDLFQTTCSLLTKLREKKYEEALVLYEILKKENGIIVEFIEKSK